MLKRKFVRIIAHPCLQGPFAWPFKVLHDLFFDPPFVADPEFARVDLEALRGKWTGKASLESAGATLKVSRAPFIFWFWFVELILLPLLALVIISRWWP